MPFADGLAVENVNRVRKCVGLVLVVVLAATGLAVASAQGATAQSVSADQSAAARCSAVHLFGAEPVDVAKTADNRTVLAQVSWGWNGYIGCYLTLDDDALATLRAAGPPDSLPRGQTETSRRCFAHHRFGADPVDAAKTADNQTVLARLSWGWHNSIGCYLVLDPAALSTLRAPAAPPEPDPPSAPTNITATPGNRQVAVTWTAPADDGGAAVSTYTLAYKATTSACPARTDNTWTIRTTASTSLSLSGLVNGSNYRLCVRANNQVGSSPWATAAATPTTTPGAPGNLAITSGDGQITVSWTAAPANGSPITGYTIQRCNATDESCTSGWINAGTTTATRYTITGLAKGTTYGIRIRAANANGSGNWSVTAFRTTDMFAPSTPSDLTATPGNGYITLSWTAPDSGGSPITGYTVECRLSANVTTSGNCNTTSWAPAPTPASETSITIGALANGVSYDLRVKANNQVGSSESTSVTATPMAVPSTPTGLQIQVDGRNIEVSWTAPTSDGGSAIIGYTVQYRTGGSASWSSVSVTGDPLPTSATLTGLTAGASYLVRVRATNAAGDSGWSPSSITPTAGGPGAPTIDSFTLPTTPNNPATVIEWTAVVKWEAPEDDGGSPISRYDVARCVGTQSACTDTRGPWRTVATVSTVSPTADEYSTPIGNLLASTRYNVRVRAANATSSGDWSSILRGTTPAATVPGVPFTTATAGNRQIAVKWTAPTDTGGARITGYTVAHKATSDACTAVDTSTDGSWTEYTTGSTSYTIRGLKNGTTYRVCVKATNQADKDSPKWSSSTATPGAAPRVPTNFTATAGDNRIDLNWGAPTDDGGELEGYYVESRHSGSSAWRSVLYVYNSIICDDSNQKLTMPITLDNGKSKNDTDDYRYCYSNERIGIYDMDVTNGSTYNVRVRAFNSNGASPWSTKTVSLPTTPTGSLSAARNGTAKQLRLTWVVYNNNSATLAVVQKEARSGNCPTNSEDTPTGWTGATGTLWNKETQGSLTTYVIDVSGLKHNTTYRLCVRDSRTNAPSGSNFWSATVSATTPTVPDRPAGFTAKAGNAKIDLSWTAYTSTGNNPTNGGTAITGYTLECKFIRGTASTSCGTSDWSDAGVTISATATTATITGLSNGAIYDVRLKATNTAGANSIGDSSWSTATNVNPSNVPAQPVISTATGGDRKITLTWTASSEGSRITDYDVQYRAGTSGAWSSHSHSGTATSATITGLINGTAYQVEVQATNANGDSPWSATTTVTPATTPDAPAGFKATAGNGQVTLGWTAYTITGNNRTDGGDDIDSYTLECRRTGGTPTKIKCSSTSWSSAGVTVSTNSATIDGLDNGVTYAVRLKATNGAGDSGWSSATGITPHTKPSAPTVTGTSGDKKVDLKWTINNQGSSTTNYQIVYKSSSSSDCPPNTENSSLDGFTTATLTLSGSSTSYTVSGLTNGTSYSLCVRATNATGYGDWGGTTATPAVKPDAPAGFTATAGNTLITLSWTAYTSTGNNRTDGGDDIDSYTLQCKQTGVTTDTTSACKESAWTSITSPAKGVTGATISNLINGAIYAVQLKATNGAGDSSWSSATGVTPHTKPDAPTVTGTSGDQKVDLTWTINNQGSSTTNYQIVYKSSSNVSCPDNTDNPDLSAFTTATLTLSGSSESYTVSGLTNATSYSLCVRATNAAGYGNWGGVVKTPNSS